MDNGQVENLKSLLEADENDAGENNRQWWVKNLNLNFRREQNENQEQNEEE